MPSLNSIVKVSITKTTITLQTRDFNRAVFVYEHTAFPENIKEYANIEAVLEDFAVNTPAYKFAAGAFAQDIQPSSILIGKKAAADSWTTTLQTLHAMRNAGFTLSRTPSKYRTFRRWPKPSDCWTRQ